MLIPVEYDRRTQIIPHEDGETVLLVHPVHAPLVIEKATRAVHCPLLSPPMAALCRHEAARSEVEAK